MNNILIFFLFLSILGTAGCSAQKEASRTITFYNVENLFDTINAIDKNDTEFLPNGKKKWSSGRYWTKIKHINETFGEMDNPIIVGLCEIENEAVVRDIVNYGPMKKTHGIVHFESADMRGIDNAIIYDSTVLALNDAGIIRFDMPEGSTPSRDIVWAKLTYSTDTIMVMVNHWPSRRGGQPVSEPKRLIAANAAVSFIDSIQNVSKSVQFVFMGDLNDSPDNIAPRKISALLKPMIDSGSGEFGGTHSYRGEWSVLDHIMVSKSFFKKKGVFAIKKSGRIISPELLKETYKGNIVPFRTYGGSKYLGGYSDHFPVSIEVGIN